MSRECQRYGVKSGYEAFIPARIAIAHCQAWPQFQTPTNGPKTEMSTELDDLCRGFDAFVLKGFEGQPYMQGIAPQVVEQLFALQDSKNSLGSHFSTYSQNLWRQALASCAVTEKSAGAPDLYTSCLASRVEWRMLLERLGKATKNSDTLLLPLVLYTEESQNNDRGIFVASRQVAIALFLISTETGELLWAGNTRSVISVKDAQRFPAFPEWQQVRDQLFSEALWKEFPGRLTIRSTAGERSRG